MEQVSQLPPLSIPSSSTSTTVPSTPATSKVVAVNVSSPHSSSSSLYRQKRHSSNTTLPGLSIRVKTILLFVFFITGAFVILLVTTGGILTSSFRTIEDSVSEKNILRLSRLLQNSLNDIITTTRDYAVWSDSVDAVDDWNVNGPEGTFYSEYLQSNFYSETGIVNQ